MECDNGFLFGGAWDEKCSRHPGKLCSLRCSYGVAVLDETEHFGALLADCPDGEAIVVMVNVHHWPSCHDGERVDDLSFVVALPENGEETWFLEAHGGLTKVHVVQDSPNTLGLLDHDTLDASLRNGVRDILASLGKSERKAKAMARKDATV